MHSINAGRVKLRSYWLHVHDKWRIGLKSKIVMTWTFLKGVFKTWKSKYYEDKIIKIIGNIRLILCALTSSRHDNISTKLMKDAIGNIIEPIL